MKTTGTYLPSVQSGLSTGPRLTQYQSSPLNDGPRTKPMEGMAMAAPITAPSPIVAPVRNLARETAALAL